MRVPPYFTFFGVAVALLLLTENSYAWQTAPGKEKVKPVSSTVSTPGNSKYSLHKASTLSGITLQPEGSTGTVLLRFDQVLIEPGTLLVKNAAGKVMFSNLLQPSKAGITHTMNIGKLIPGLYSIEVKTTETTFWKKVRVRN